MWRDQFWMLYIRLRLQWREWWEIRRKVRLLKRKRSRWNGQAWDVLYMTPEEKRRWLREYEKASPWVLGGKDDEQPGRKGLSDCRGSR